MAMKKQLLTLIFLMGLFTVAQAQFHAPNCLTCPKSLVCNKFYEDFEGISPSRFSKRLVSGTSTDNNFLLDSSIVFEGRRVIKGKASYNAALNQIGEVYIESDTFCTLGNQQVFLSFGHICKIAPYDSAFIEISKNGGPWIRITCDDTTTKNVIEGNTQYLTDGDDMLTYKIGSNYITSLSYPIAWQQSQNNTPSASWYKKEMFDISGLASDANDVKVRFGLITSDILASTYFGWLLDSVRITVKLSEEIPPVITHTPYSGGLFGIDQPIVANITDANGVPLKSGVKEAKVFYKINGGTLDSLPMTRSTGSQFVANMFRPIVKDGDTIEYYIWALDSAYSMNEAYNRPSSNGFYKYWVSGKPFVEYPGPGTTYPLGPVYLGEAFQVGNICFEATMDDASGIQDAKFYYSKNGAPIDSILMTNIGLNPAGFKIFQACLNVAKNDSIAYYVYAKDSSVSGFETYLPNVPGGDTLRWFIARQGLTFPWCDNVDSLTGWTTYGKWHRANLNKTILTGPNHSGGYSFVTDSAARYAPNANWTLETPVLSFLGIQDAVLSFYQWRDINAGTTLPTAQNGLGDAFYLEWSNDWNSPSGATWSHLDNTIPGSSNNWYNRSSFQIFNNRGFDGNTNGWQKSEVVLSQLNNKQNVKIRFVFRSNSTNTLGDGVALDDICISKPLPDDVGILQVSNPASEGLAGSIDSVVVAVKNYGSKSISSVPVSFNVNGNKHTKTINFSPALAPNALSSMVLVDTFTVPEYSFNVCVFSELAGDGNASNDTFCLTSFGVPFLGLPYADSFDTLPNKWLARTDILSVSNQWFQGNPSKASISSSFSAPNCWVSQLTSPAAINSSSSVYSPYFDFSNAVNTKLSFYQNRKLSANTIVRLQYTTDNGNSWNNVGSTGVVQPNGNNWFNGSVTGLSGWTGNTTGWVKSELRLPANFDYLTLPVRFRFSITVSNTPCEGFAFDDFKIDLPPSKDAGVTAIINPVGLPNAQPTNVKIQVQVKNYGRDTLYSVPINYIRRSGNKWLATSYIKPNDTLAPGKFGIYDVPGYTSDDSYYGTYNLCAFTEVPNDGDFSNDSTCKAIREIYRREVQFISLSSPIYALCSPADTQDVCFIVKNNGHLAMDSLKFVWTLNNVTDSFSIPSPNLTISMVTDSIAKICIPGKSAIIGIGNNPFSVRTIQLGDGIPGNNDLKNITIVGNPTIPLDTCWNFDDANPKLGICIDTIGSATAPSQINSGAGFNGSDALSYVATASTPAWVASNVNNIWNYNQNQQYRAREVIMVNTTNKTNVHIKFRINQVCKSGGEAYFRVLANNQQAGQTYNCVSDPNFANLIDIDLSPYYVLGKPLTVTLETKNKPSNFASSSETIIDDVCLYNQLLHSAKANTVITIPPILKVGDVDSLKINIKNTGVRPLTKVKVGGKINGTVWPNQTISGLNLVYGDSVDYVFPFTFTPIAGINEICVWTAEPNDTIDQNRFDDTLCYYPTAFDTINNLISTPYCNDFDSGKPKWVALNARTYTMSNSIWAEGSPTKRYINGPYNGTNAWVTALDSNYARRANSALFTPIFGIEPGKCYDMSFMHKFEIDTTGDGGNIEFTVDNGNRWEQFGFNQTNWFNQYYVPSLWDYASTPSLFGGGWSGKSNGWIFAKNTFSLDSTKFSLPKYSVIFRFRFASDNTINKEGWAIDSFCLSYTGVGCKPTAIRNLKKDSWLVNAVYPNPAHDKAIVPFALPTPGRVVYQITDLMGKVIQLKDMGVMGSGQNSFEVNTSDFTSGVYFITLIYQGQRNTQKLMIVK